MFLKPFTVKSSQVAKGAVRKQLQKQFQEKFKCDNKVHEIIPKKEEIRQMRILTRQGQKVLVYMVTKTPIAFEYEGCLYPTIFALWIKPDLMKTLVINPPTMKNLSSGADLMLPGIVMKNEELPAVENNDIVGLRVPGNLSCVAVGVALMSTKEMIQNEMKGKGIKILHTFGDQLWSLTQKGLPVIDPEIIEDAATDSDSEIGISAVEIKNASVDLVISESDDEADPVIQQKEMDNLLHSCALHALKSDIKNADLPLLTSTFYRVHMSARCPAEKQLSIKHSKHKKLSSFLKELSDENLIVLEDLTKGCTSITSVNRRHPLLKELEQAPLSSDEEDARISSSFGFISQDKYHPPEFVALHKVSPKVQSLFEAMNCKKNMVLTTSEVRNMVRKYVTDNNLNSGDKVTLDPILHRIIHKHSSGEEKVEWNDLFTTQAIFNKMGESYKLILPGIVPVIQSGKIPSIHVVVEKRRGKEVTLIENLEPFMIKVDEFVAILRKKAQASTSVKVIQPRGVSQKQVYKQVLVQGNQLKCIESIICGPSYGLNKKFIKKVASSHKPVS